MVLLLLISKEFIADRKNSYAGTTFNNVIWFKVFTQRYCKGIIKWYCHGKQYLPYAVS